MTEPQEFELTGEEFRELIEESPDFCKDLCVPIDITTPAEMEGTEITHLSQFLTFKESANFKSCKFLFNASGTFEDFVDFSYSSIQTIENLWAYGETTEGWSAAFTSCEDLENASGTFKAFVSFYKSGVSKIENIFVGGPNNAGHYADFSKCPNLQTLHNWDMTKPVDIEKEKSVEAKEKFSLKKYRKKTDPKPLPFSL
jgi:hypothetical protein